MLHANFEPNFFILAMIIGSIDFHHFMSFSVTLTLAVVRSVENEIFWLHFLSHFQLNGTKFVVVLKQFKLNILRLLSQTMDSREITAVLLATSKTFNVGMHLDISQLI